VRTPGQDDGQGVDSETSAPARTQLQKSGFAIMG